MTIVSSVCAGVGNRYAFQEEITVHDKMKGTLDPQGVYTGKSLIIQATPAAIIAIRSCASIGCGFPVTTGRNSAFPLVLHPSFEAALRADFGSAVLLVAVDNIGIRLSSLDAVFLELFLVLLAEIRQRIQ